MDTQIYRSYKEPERQGLSYDQRWNGRDKGLINCWEIGRKLRSEYPDVALRAEKGELPILVWKGGVGEDTKSTKNTKKYGSLYYLAQWQGLRCEDLNIDLSKETNLVCSKTGKTVTYTIDVKKYG